MSSLVFAAAVACASAQAAPPQPAAPDENALKLDQAGQALKDEALKFNSDAERLEQDSLYPSYSRVTVFLGVRVNALLVHELSVSIDGGAPQNLVLSDDEARVLPGSSDLVRVLRMNLTPGTHRIHAEFTAQYADAKATDAPVRGAYEALFDKDYGPADLELTLAHSSRLSKPGLSLRQSRPAR